MDDPRDPTDDLPRTEAIPFTVSAPTEAGAWIWTRNGAPQITAVDIRYGDESPDGVSIVGIGKRNSEFEKGGLRISAAAMDMLCALWMEARMAKIIAEGTFMASLHLGPFRGDDPDTVAKDVYAYLDSTASLTEFTVFLTDHRGRVSEIDLTQFEITALFDHADTAGA